MKSLYAQYIKEREGSSVIEEPWGFIEYRLAPPVMRIESLYILPEYRKTNKGSELANRVTLLAWDAGATHLWAQVWVGALNATDSLKAILAYGFQITAAQNDCIILTKDISGERNG